MLNVRPLLLVLTSLIFAGAASGKGVEARDAAAIQLMSLFQPQPHDTRGKAKDFNLFVTCEQEWGQGCSYVEAPLNQDINPFHVRRLLASSSPQVKHYSPEQSDDIKDYFKDLGERHSPLPFVACQLQCVSKGKKSVCSLTHIR